MRANKEDVEQRGSDYNGGNQQQEYNNPTQVKQEPVKVGPKVGRNDPCPCGSGKKYKNCHGRDEG